MAKLVVGILIGLVLGLYLESASAGNGAEPLAQIGTAMRNLLLH